MNEKIQGVFWDWKHYLVVSLLFLLLIGCESEALEPTILPTPSPTTEPTIEPTPEPIITPEPYGGFSLYEPNILVKTIYSFSGQVTKDQIFEKHVSDDLLFCLLPFGSGWEIVISGKPADKCDYLSSDFAGIVSPPFHGTNPIFIEGWHFRNVTNTGPNPNDGSVNAPQENRWFNFVLSEKDYQAVWAASYCYHRGLCTEGTESLEPEQAKIIIEQTPKSRGTLTITHLELGNLVVGEEPRIEYMEFDVKLALPKGYINEPK